MRKLKARTAARPSPAAWKRLMTSARPAARAVFNSANTAARSSAGGRSASAMAAKAPARARRSMMARWSWMVSMNPVGSSARHARPRNSERAAGAPGNVGADSALAAFIGRLGYLSTSSPSLARNPRRSEENVAHRNALGAQKAALWHKTRYFGGRTRDFQPPTGPNPPPTHGIAHENPDLNIDFRFPNGRLCQ